VSGKGEKREKNIVFFVSGKFAFYFMASFEYIPRGNDIFHVAMIMISRNSPCFLFDSCSSS